MDSIPVLRAIEQGYDKNVVVLTRNRGYRKKGKDMKIPHFIYWGACDNVDKRVQFFQISHVYTYAHVRSTKMFQTS